MKKGDLLNGLAVVDVKRITSLNLTAFTRDIVKYLDEGYRIDISSTREVGLQKRVDMFKVESNLSGNVGSVGDNTEDLLLTVNGVEVNGFVEGTDIAVTSDEVRQEVVEKSVEEAKEALDNFTTPEQNGATVKKQTQTRAKKTT